MTKSLKPLVIDCQVLQTAAWTRGMGRYLVSFIMGLFENEDCPEITLIFDKNLKLPKDCVAALARVAPKANQVFLDLEKGLSDSVAQANIKVLDAFIAKAHLEDSIYINGSIFSFDYAPIFPTLTYNTCIFYDMIPLKRWSTFYKYFPEEEYFKRYKHLYNCQLLLAISEAVRQDLFALLGFSLNKIVNISGAEIPHFLEAMNESTNPIVNRPYRYVILPGGNSPHKNMLRAIKAFDNSNAIFGDSFKLVITSFYSEENIRLMKALSPNIELTGNVPDKELHELYKGAEVVMFSSLDEGLGLPVLEAVGYDLKVACSSIPVFNEISKKAFYFFDPEDVDSMTDALTNAILGTKWDVKREHYKIIKRTFTWKNSGRRLLDGLSKAEVKTNQFPAKSIIIEQVNDADSVRKVSAELATVSLQTATLYIDTLEELRKQPNQLPVICKYFLPTYDICDAPRRVKGDATVVLTSNSRYSVAIGLALQASFVGDAKKAKAAAAKLIGDMRKSDVTDETERELVDKILGLLNDKYA